jgi:hypothetical protein
MGLHRNECSIPFTRSKSEFALLKIFSACFLHVTPPSITCHVETLLAFALTGDFVIPCDYGLAASHRVDDCRNDSGDFYLAQISPAQIRFPVRFTLRLFRQQRARERLYHLSHSQGRTA